MTNFVVCYGGEVIWFIFSHTISFHFLTTLCISNQILRTIFRNKIWSWATPLFICCFSEGLSISTKSKMRFLKVDRQCFGISSVLKGVHIVFYVTFLGEADERWWFFSMNIIRSSFRILKTMHLQCLFKFIVVFAGRYELCIL